MTTEKQAADHAEHQLDWHIAQGGTVPKKKREKEAVWPDNLVRRDGDESEELIAIGLGSKRGITLYQSANPEGDNGNKKRGATNLGKFGAQCAAALGPRFRIEKWTYKARTPKQIAAWDFDLDDKAGSALGSPPGTLFEGVFSLPKSAGRRWTAHNEEKDWMVIAPAVRQMLDEMEADK